MKNIYLVVSDDYSAETGGVSHILAFTSEEQATNLVADLNKRVYDAIVPLRNARSSDLLRKAVIDAVKHIDTDIEETLCNPHALTYDYVAVELRET